MDASTKQWIVLKHDSSTRFHLLIWTLIETDNCNKTCWTQASLVAQPVKNLPATQENWVPSLGWEDPLEKGKAAHSSILAWRIPWTVQSMGSQRVGHDWATFTFMLCWPPPPWSRGTSLHKGCPLPLKARGGSQPAVVTHLPTGDDPPWCSPCTSRHSCTCRRALSLLPGSGCAHT